MTDMFTRVFKGVPDEHAKDDGNVLFRPSMVGGSTGSTRRLRTHGYPNMNQLTYSYGGDST